MKYAEPLEIAGQKLGGILSTVFVISGESANKTRQPLEKVCNLAWILANFGVDRRRKVDLHRFLCSVPLTAWSGEFSVPDGGHPLNELVRHPLLRVTFRA